MHEISLCEGILEVIQEHRHRDHFEKVIAIWLELGRFSCVERAALNFAFDAVVKGTVVEGAKLTLLDVPGRALCYTCHREVTLDNRLDVCPECAGDALMPISGDQLRIKHIEVI